MTTRFDLKHVERMYISLSISTRLVSLNDISIKRHTTRLSVNANVTTTTSKLVKNRDGTRDVC